MDSPLSTPPTPTTAAGQLFAVLLVTFLLFAPSVGNGFTWDDRWAAMGDNGSTRNPMVAELRPIDEYFTTHYWPARTPVSQAYRPVTVLSFAATHAVFGDDPKPGHLGNVLLHTAATGLGCALLVALGVAWPAACLGALVFGVHAIHSEVVANIVGRAELLGFCFGIGALLVLMRVRRASAWRFVLHYPIASALLFLAFHSKESALAWAAFIPLVLWTRRATRRGWCDVLATLLAVAAPACAFIALRAHMLSLLPGTVDPSVGYLENPLLHAPAMTRVLSGTLTWGLGLLLTALPLSLAVDYGPCMLPIATSPAEPWGAAALGVGAVLLAAMIAAVFAMRRHHTLFLAAACFFGFSFVVTNIAFPVFMMFAERTWYTPSFGLALLVAGIATRLPRGGRVAPIGMLALGAWVGASCLTAFGRNAVWHDDDTLVLEEVQAHPSSVRLQLCAGDLWFDRKDLEEAREHFEAAARLDPLAPQPWLELAQVDLRRGKPADAEAALRRALLGRGADLQPREVEVRTALAHALLLQGREDESLAELERIPAGVELPKDLEVLRAQHAAPTVAPPAPAPDRRD